MKISKELDISENVLQKRNYVGRSEEINDFFNDYYRHNKDDKTWDVSVVNFWGMPGIGKSELLNELQNIHRERGLQSVMYVFDVNDTFLNNIILLRKQIQNILGYEFPLFDMAYVYYCNQCGKSKKDLESTGILNSKWMESIYPILNVIPGVNIGAAILQVLKHYEEELIHSIKEEDLVFINRSPFEILKQLPKLFIRDLYLSLRKENEPIIIFLDDIGEFCEKKDFLDWFMRKDSIWRNLCNVVWCLATHKEIISDTEKFIRNVPLDSLSYEEVKEYLENAGVNKELYKKIYTISEGIPAYVDIMVENYYLQEQGEELSDIFEIGEKDYSVEYYYQNLNEKEKQVLQIMSILENWKDEEIEILLEIYNIDISDYHKIRSQRYVHKFQDRYYLQSLVQEIIQKNLSENLYKKIYSYARGTRIEDEWIRQFALKSRLASARDESDANRMVFELYKQISIQEGIPNYDVLYRIHRTICKSKYGKKGIIGVGISYFMLAKTCKEIGLHEYLLEYSQIAYEILSESEKPDFISQKYYKMLVLMVWEEYANSLMINREFDRSIEIREEILNETIRTTGSKSYETLSAKQNLCLAKLNSKNHIKTVDSEIEYIIKQRRKMVLRNPIQKKQNSEYIITSKIMLCNAYHNKGEDGKALKLCFETWEESHRLLGKDNSITHEVLKATSDILMDLRQYADAVKILEPLYDDVLEKLGEDSQTIQSIRYALGIAYGETGRAEEGAEILLSLYTKAYDTRGVTDKLTLQYMKEYAICIAEGGNHQKAFEILCDCKNNYERVYGADESSQYKNLISSLEREKRLLK